MTRALFAAAGLTLAIAACTNPAPPVPEENPVSAGAASPAEAELDDRGAGEPAELEGQDRSDDADSGEVSDGRVNGIDRQGDGDLQECARGCGRWTMTCSPPRALRWVRCQHG